MRGTAGGFDLVMFDLDGTLVATAPDIQDAVNDTLGSLGLAAVGLAQVETWIGHGTRELLLQAVSCSSGSDPQTVRGSGLFQQALAGFNLAYDHRSGSGSRLYPQVREVLAALGRRGVKRAVVTNKETRFTASLLRRHGLEPLVDRTICGDTLPTRKPDPAGVLDCIAAFGTSARRSLFVGDSSIDVATARNAGVPVWAVTYGYNMGQPIAASQPDRLLGSLAPLLEPTTEPQMESPPWQ